MKVHLYPKAHRAELSAVGCVTIILVAGVIAKSGIALQLAHLLH